MRWKRKWALLPFALDSVAGIAFFFSKIQSLVCRDLFLTNFPSLLLHWNIRGAVSETIIHLKMRKNTSTNWKYPGPLTASLTCDKPHGSPNHHDGWQRKPAWQQQCLLCTRKGHRTRFCFHLQPSCSAEWFNNEIYPHETNWLRDRSVWHHWHPKPEIPLGFSMLFAKRYENVEEKVPKIECATKHEFLFVVQKHLFFFCFVLQERKYTWWCRSLVLNQEIQLARGFCQEHVLAELQD